MSKGFDPVHGYNSPVNHDDVTAYGMPPKPHRLARANQPTYVPAAMPPRRKVTPLELDRQVIEVRYSDGRTGKKPADQLAREKLIQRSLGGDMRSAAELSAHLDWEADTWMERPRYKKSRRSNSHAGAVRPMWQRLPRSDSGRTCPVDREPSPPSPFKRFNSSPEVIRLVVLMYVRFPLSLRNVEDLLFERGIDVCHETIRFWWNRFGPLFASDIRRQRVSAMRGLRHWRWHLDEVFVKINGETHYLWRAVDHEGEILESYVTRTRDKKAALAFMRKALKRHGSPERITTDGLRSYGAAMRELGNADRREVGRHANNPVENSHLPLRRRERAMLRFRP